MFKPRYTLKSSIVTMLTAIAEAKAVIEHARILPQHEVKLRRQALIRMTHSSTAIEGNMLNVNQVEALAANRKIDAPDRDIHEVKNYLQGLHYIEQIVKKKQPITERVVLRIHKLVTKNTLPSDKSGHYRKGHVYIVRRRVGMPQEVVYTGPDSKQVPALMKDLVAWINESEKQDVNPVITAGIVHQELAAIHPFADGNGRTARALATLILYQRGYDFRKLFALEDYYNEDRPAYYKAINIGKDYESRRVDFTPWLEYFVRGFKEEIDSVKGKVTQLAARKVDGKITSQVYLDPEQVKILDFIEQVGRITVKDVVDILSCPKRTAQLELQRLKNSRLSNKLAKAPPRRTSCGNTRYFIAPARLWRERSAAISSMSSPSGIGDPQLSLRGA